MGKHIISFKTKDGVIANYVQNMCWLFFADKHEDFIEKDAAFLALNANYTA